jgi:O-antigen ligase
LKIFTFLAAIAVLSLSKDQRSQREVFTFEPYLTFMTLRDKLLFAAILLFTTVLFFPSLEAVNFIIVAFVIIAAWSHGSFKEKLDMFKQRRYLFLMLAFFVWVLISVLLSDNQKAGFRYLNSRLPLLYFPLSIGLLKLEKNFRDKILLGIAIIITVFAVACLGYGIYRSAALNNTAYLYNDALSEPVTGQQSIYVALLVNFAIYIFAWLLFYRSIAYKGWLLFAILFLFVIHFLLASRIMMGVLYLSVLAFVFYYIFRRKKYLEGATLIMALVIGGFLIYKFFPKTINRFKELAYTQFNYQQTGVESHFNMTVEEGQWNGANTRLAIWPCGWQLFKQQPLTGVHLGDKKDRLMEVYRQKGFSFAIRTQKNLHNNYLDTLVGLGIIGLLLFVAGWLLLPAWIAFRHRDGLALLMIVTLAIAMITENYLDRNLGGMLVGFFIPFLLSDKTQRTT